VCVCGWVGGAWLARAFVLVHLCACEYVHVCVHACACASHMVYIHAHNVYRYQSLQLINGSKVLGRGGGLGSRPKKMYGERLGDGVEYHSM